MSVGQYSEVWLLKRFDSTNQHNMHTCAGWWLLNNRFHQNQSHIERALLLMCIQSLDVVGATYFQYAHPTIERRWIWPALRAYSNRYCFILHIENDMCAEGYWNWRRVGASVRIYIETVWARKTNQFESSITHINIRHTFSVGFHPANSKYRFSLHCV